MPESTPIVLILLGAAVGCLLGGALLALWVPRWRRAAHAAGQASRDAEVATLDAQREAALARADELGARLRRAESDAEAATQRLREVGEAASAQRAEAEQLGSQLGEARRSRDEAQARLLELTREHSALQAASREQAQAAADRLALLDQAEQRLRDSFQNLANQILDAKSERLREQSSQQLGGLLEPLKLQLKEFRETVSATWASDQHERGALSQQIRDLHALNQRMSQDAVNLTRALKGDSQAQGAWGELVLERVLEASGLQAGREYDVQASYADGEGGRQRPDVIVHLPEDKDIVIDAKMSLVAYERFVAAVDDEARRPALADHVASLRRHIDGLSARNYRDLDGLRTLDFVLLFVPVEAAFIEAVRADPGLYAHALGKNISLVSPSTLLATLRTVAHLWRIERRNARADEIARRAALLHDNFALLVDELVALGEQLGKAQRAHAGVLRRLTEGGKGSVLLQVQSLAEIAPVKKALPAGLLGAADATADDAAPGPAA